VEAEEGKSQRKIDGGCTRRDDSIVFKGASRADVRLKGATPLLIRTALLLEFGGMGIGATDFIRLLMRKLTFDRISLLLAAFVQER
jgi:hypothetical protein